MTAQYEEASFKLANAETQIEELKLQLDDALGAEDLVEQLTERNLMLGEVRPITMVLDRERSSKGLSYSENRGDADHDRRPRSSQDPE